MNTPALAAPLEQDSAPLGPAIGDYLTVVVRRAGTIVVPFVLFTLGSVATAFLVPPTYYEATTVRIVDPDVVGSFYGQLGLPVPHKQILSTIKQDVASVSFLEELVEKADVDEGYNRHDRRQYERLMAEVKGNLTVNVAAQKIGDDIISFGYKGRDARKVAEFVNAIREKYKEEFTVRYQTEVKNAWRFVKAQHDKAKAAADAASKQLKEFQDSYGALFVGNTSDVGMQLRTALAKADDDLSTFEGALAGQEEVLRDVEGKLAVENPMMDGGAARVLNPVYVALKAQVDQLTADVEALALRTTEQHPTYIAAKASLEAAQAKLAQVQPTDAGPTNPVPNPNYDRLVGMQKAAQAEIARLKPVIARTKERIASLNKDMVGLPENLKRADELADRRNTTQFQYDKAQKQFAAVDATHERVMSKETSFFKLIDAPTAESARDKDPVAPNVPLFIGVGAFVGLAIGAGLAFVREFSTPAFTTPNQVRYGLALPVLGEIAPLLTKAESAERRRSRVLWTVVIAATVLVVGWFHLAYFNAELKGSLPRQVFDVMRKIYGKV